MSQPPSTGPDRCTSRRLFGRGRRLRCAYYENTLGGGLGWCGVHPQDHFHPSRCGRPPAAGLTLWCFLFLSFIESPDFHDIFGGTYTFSATQHQGTTKAFLSVVHNGRWVPVQDTALAY